MRTSLPALLAGALILGAPTLVTANDPVPLGEARLDAITAGTYGYAAYVKVESKKSSSGGYYLRGTAGGFSTAEAAQSEALMAYPSADKIQVYKEK